MNGTKPKSRPVADPRVVGQTFCERLAAIGDLIDRGKCVDALAMANGVQGDASAFAQRTKAPSDVAAATEVARVAEALIQEAKDAMG